MVKWRNTVVASRCIARFVEKGLQSGIMWGNPTHVNQCGHHMYRVACGKNHHWVCICHNVNSISPSLVSLSVFTSSMAFIDMHKNTISTNQQGFAWCHESNKPSEFGKYTDTFQKGILLSFRAILTKYGMYTDEVYWSHSLIYDWHYKAIQTERSNIAQFTYPHIARQKCVQCCRIHAV